MSGLPAIVGHEPGDVQIVTADGEALSPYDATDEQIAAWRRAVMEWETAARTAKKFVDSVIVGRMDAEAQWTIHAGRFTLTAPSPAPTVEYPDPEGLRAALAALPGLSGDAVDRAVVPVTVFKPSAAGIKKLRALHRADVDDVLDAYSEDVQKDRRVSVKEAA